MNPFILRSFLVFTQCCSMVRGRGSLRGHEQDSQHIDRSLIIGGEAATAGDYPYFAYFQSPGCGGTLIAPDIVLTAGHCKVDNLSDYGTIYVGRYDSRNNRDNAQQFNVVEEIRHGDYKDDVCCGYHKGSSFNGVVKDFMLLKLSGESSNPVIRLNEIPSKPERRQELHVIGFGDMHPGPAYVPPNQLHEVTVNYMTNKQCVAFSIYPDNLLDESSMCAIDYREDACGGDSGGPLILKGPNDSEDIQVGVVSWGWGCAIQPGVYARISAGYDWIRKEVCDRSNNPPASFQCPQSVVADPDMTAAPADMTSNDMNRSLLPEGRSCPIASNSPSVCCSSLANKGNRIGEQCAPVKFSSKGGVRCVPLDWVMEKIPWAYDAGVCEALMSGLQLLPEGQSCSSVTDRIQCCQYLDNRSDGSVYDGQPCVASRQQTGFPRSGGVCEPANFVAEFAPGQALGCADVRARAAPSSGNSTPEKGAIDSIEFDSVVEEADGDQKEREVASRTALPNEKSCRAVSDVHVCCAARDAGGKFRDQDCLPSVNGRKFSSRRSCEPTDRVEKNDISSYEGYCEALLSDRTPLPYGNTCSSLTYTGSCCNALDSDGQPCLPSKRASGFSTKSKCEPASWVAENDPNGVLDCLRY